MKQRSGILTLILIFTLIIAVWATMPNRVSVAQNDSGERISELETRVAALEQTVYGEATPVQMQATAIAEGKTIKGSGTNLSESFSLPEGQYRVQVSYTIVAPSDFIGIDLVGAGGQTKSIFNTAESAGDWNASSLLNLGGGDYFLQVKAANDTTWQVIFSPL